MAVELAGDPGVGIPRQLVWDSRAGTIADTLKLTGRLLLMQGGEPFVRSLLGAFFHESPLELFGLAEAEAFASYLKDRSEDIPYLEKVLGFEHAALRAVVEGRAQLVEAAPTAAYDERYDAWRAPEQFVRVLQQDLSGR